MAQYLDLEYLEDMSAGDEDFKREIISTFQSSFPPLLELLEKSFSENDAPQVRFASHKAKSTAGFLGIPNMAHLLEIVERTAREKPTEIGALADEVKEILRLGYAALEESKTVL